MCKINFYMCTELLLHWYFYLSNTWKTRQRWCGMAGGFLDQWSKLPMKQNAKKLPRLFPPNLSTKLWFHKKDLNLSIGKKSPTWCRASGQQACRSHRLIRTRETTTAAGPGHLPALLITPIFHQTSSLPLYSALLPTQLQHPLPFLSS